MLNKKARISRVEFGRKPIRSKVFAFGSIKILPGTKGAGAVVISKKTCRTAVGRNKVRRRFYSLLAGLERSGRLTSPVVIYPNKAALSASFGDLREAVQKLLANS